MNEWKALIVKNKVLSFQLNRKFNDRQKTLTLLLVQEN